MNQDPTIPPPDEVVIDATGGTTDAPAAVPSPAADASAASPVAPDVPASVAATVADSDPSGGTVAEGASAAPSTDSTSDEVAPESFSPPTPPTLPDPEVPLVTELPNATEIPAPDPSGEDAVGDYVAPPMPFKIAERLDQEGLENYIRTYPEVNLPDNHNLSVDELRHYAGWVTQASQQGKSAAQFPKPRGLWLTNYRIAKAAAEAAAIAVAEAVSDEQPA